MASITYGQVLAQNIRAARNLKGIGQESVATRMRALGHVAWLRQTVSSTEKGRRRVTAEEVFALALALETSIPRLTAPVTDVEDVVELPGGSIGVVAVARLAAGVNDRSIEWDGDVPVFTPGSRLAPPLARIVAEALEGDQRGAGD